MDRPICAPKQPDVGQSQELLNKLLAIELERLETAVRIEKERKIVFPETSIIIHDIQKLQAAINGKQESQDTLGTLFEDIGKLDGW